MKELAVYAHELDSLPDEVRIWLDYPRHTHSEAQLSLIYASNDIRIRLWDILVLNETMGGFSHDFVPDQVLPHLGSLVVVPELQGLVDTLAHDYDCYLALEASFDEQLAVSDKSTAIQMWWFVHCGSDEVSGEWLNLSESKAEKVLKELMKRDKDTWLKEPPSPELDAVLSHFSDSTGGVCPKCKSTRAKRNGMDRYGKQRYKCKDCGSRY